MEFLVLLLFFVGLAVFASAFGHDSREVAGCPPDGDKLWSRGP
jgi:hypothetical protein